MFDNMKIGKLAQTGDPGGLPNFILKAQQKFTEEAKDGFNLQKINFKHIFAKLK